MTVLEQYLQGIRERLVAIARTQSEQIQEAGLLIANTVERGGLVHTFGTGHSHLLAEELFSRAGGLLCVNVIQSPPLMLHEDVVASGAWERLSGVAAILLDHADIDPQSDVLIVISNSGRNAAPVEAAEWARDHGMPVIALTSLAHSHSLPSALASGKKLCDVANVILDNLGRPGDALVDVGQGQAAGASSTVLGASLLECAVLSAIEECLRRGIPAPVLVSSNVAGASEANTRLVSEYAGRLPEAYARLRRQINSRQLAHV